MFLSAAGCPFGTCWAGCASLGIVWHFWNFAEASANCKNKLQKKHALATRSKAIASRLEAIATRLEAIAIRLEVVALVFIL